MEGKPMRTLLVELWPYFVGSLIQLLVAVAGVMAGSVMCNVFPASQLACYVVGGAMSLAMLRPLRVAFGTWRWTWRFAQHVQSFGTEASDKVTLRYSPRISDRNKVMALLQKIENSLQELT